MQVAQVSRVVLVAASSRTERIVSSSSIAVRARAGRTADGGFDVLALGWSGSVSASTRSRCLGLRCFVWSPLATASLPR